MPVNLQKLDAPQVIEKLSYEELLKQHIALLQQHLPDYQPHEADYQLPLLEVASYRDQLLRHRINGAAKSLLLAYATGADLDHLAATYYNGLQRLLVAEAQPNLLPPKPAIYESDDRFRERCRLSLYAYSTAGSAGAYKFHAMTASADVKDVSVAKHTPAPGDVTLSILSVSGDGTTTTATLDRINKALNAETVRPINDSVFVQSAQVVAWTLDATLICYPDANNSFILEQSQQRMQSFVKVQHALDHNITLSALHAALYVEGVQEVIVHTPASNIMINDNQAAYNTAISIKLGGYNV